MTAVQQLITQMLAGEQAPAPHTEELKAVLQGLRDTLRDREAQRQLGLHVLSQISGHIKSSVHTAKAMHRASAVGKETDEGHDDDE